MPVEIDIIIPVCNEAANIIPLVEEVTEAMRSHNGLYQLVFVDDGSTDETWRRIADAARTNSVVHGLRHQRNAGQSAALWTGISNTTAPIIATLDGDRQNDPADLPKMISALTACDFVAGVRHKRKDGFVKRVSSRVARWARKTVLGVDFQDTGCAARAFKRTAIEGVFPFNGWHRFLPILVHGAGRNVKEVPVNHRKRVAGVSKYGVWNRLGRGIADLFAVAWLNRRRLNRVPLQPPSTPS